MKKKRTLWYEAVFLAGDPVYYGRFGFKSVSELGLLPSIDISSQYVQVFELIPGALSDQRRAVVELAT